VLTTSFTRPPRYRAPLVALCMMIWAGCDSTSMPTPPSADAAKQVLDRALTAWKQGETIEAVKKGSPPIEVIDPVWMHGAKLTDYEVQGEGRPSGAQLAYRVKLSLTEASGKKSEITVTYEVGTDPILTVVRPIFGSGK
jgi:hypothetical protein